METMENQNPDWLTRSLLDTILIVLHCTHAQSSPLILHIHLSNSIILYSQESSGIKLIPFNLTSPKLSWPITILNIFGVKILDVGLANHIWVTFLCLMLKLHFFHAQPFSLIPTIYLSHLIISPVASRWGISSLPLSNCLNTLLPVKSHALSHPYTRNAMLLVLQNAASFSSQESRSQQMRGCPAGSNRLDTTGRICQKHSWVRKCPTIPTPEAITQPR